MVKWLSGALMGLSLCVPAVAGDWVICDARIHVTGHRGGRLQAEVLQALPTRGAPCFQPSQRLDFVPQTPDYQQLLRRRAWPQPGDRALLRYRSLTGFCKRDGASGPCIIEHYSILRQTKP